MIKIKAARSVIEREPLKEPFGFKGGSLSELWQVVVKIESEGDHSAIGLGVQSVLWSEPEIFAAYSEEEGNKLMYKITQKALQLILEVPFKNPIALLETIFDALYRYAQKITGHSTLQKTFVLNALVPVDNAVWLLYASENKITDFEKMVSPFIQPTLFSRNNKIAGVPLISYGTTDQTIKQYLAGGYFFLKIKLGHSGTQKEMLEKDKVRLTHIHHLTAATETPYTSEGKILYYLDANGRYQQKETLEHFLDHARKIKAIEQIAILEEPFSYKDQKDVSDMGIRIAADESAHTDKEVWSLIQMGYGAIALKPVAKTLSMTIKILNVASKYNTSCFCADLTANPILVEWNKNVAARLAKFPGLSFNLLESNGQQNYKNWDILCAYNPTNEHSWTKDKNGIFELNNNYYELSGGIFEQSKHYENLFKN